MATIVSHHHLEETAITVSSAGFFVMSIIIIILELFYPQYPPTYDWLVLILGVSVILFVFLIIAQKIQKRNKHS